MALATDSFSLLTITSGTSGSTVPLEFLLLADYFHYPYTSLMTFPAVPLSASNMAGPLLSRPPSAGHRRINGLKLFHSAGSSIQLLMVAIVSRCASILAAAAMPFATSRVVCGLALGDTRETILAVARTFQISACIFVCTALGGCFARLFVEGEAAKLHIKCWRSVFKQDIGWFDNHSAESLPATVEADISAISAFIGEGVCTLIASAVSIPLCYGLALFRGKEIVFIMTLAVPFTVVGGIVIKSAMSHVLCETQGWYTHAGHIAMESIRGIRTVMSCGGEAGTLARYQGAVREAERRGVRSAAQVGFGVGYNFATQMISMALAIACAGRLRQEGVRSWWTDKLYNGSDALCCFQLFMLSGIAWTMLFRCLGQLDEARAAGARLLRIIENKPAIEQDSEEPHGTLLESVSSVELKNVVFSYPSCPEVRVLNGVSLWIDGGQRVAIVGCAGSGQSAIVSLLQRFYDPDAGRVLINSHDLKTFNLRHLRTKLGMITQDPVLFSGTVDQNILYSHPNATEDELRTVSSLAQLDFVDNLPHGFATQVGEGGVQLTHGNKQLITLARVLLRKPLILLDGGPSHADAECPVQDMLAKLNSYLARNKITTISVTSHAPTMQKSDVIFVMKDGMVVEHGSHAELVNRDDYYALYSTDSRELLIHHSPSSNSLVNSAKDGKAPSLSDKVIAVEKARGAILQKSYKVPVMRFASIAGKSIYWMVPGFLFTAAFAAKAPVAGLCLMYGISEIFAPPSLVGHEMESVIKTCHILAAAAFVCGFLQSAFMGIVRESITGRLREATFARYLRVPVCYHEDPGHAPNKLLFALSTYTFRAALLFVSSQYYVEAASSVVVGLIIGAYFSWKMTLWMVLITPLIAFGQWIRTKATRLGSQMNAEPLSKLEHIVCDSISKMKTIRAEGAEGDVLKKIEAKVRVVQGRGIWASSVSGVNAGFGDSLSYFVMGICLFAAPLIAQRTYHGWSDVLTAITVVMMGVMGASGSLNFVSDSGRNVVACHDLFNLLDEKVSVRAEEGAKPDGEEIGCIEFDNVVFRYSTTEFSVLNGVSFTVEVGNSVGLVGQVGSGKSTIFSLIQRFYTPAAGKIVVGTARIPLDSLDIKWWRSKIGVVTKEPVLFDLTVRENILYGLTSHSKPWFERCQKMCNLDFVSRLRNGLDAFVGPAGTHITMSQRQRVALCRAMVRDPAILLLDEATAVSEPGPEEQKLQSALENATEGRTSFQTPHRLSSVERCDLILVLHRGEIVQLGTHNELRGVAGFYAKLLSRRK